MRKISRHLVPIAFLMGFPAAAQAHVPQDLSAPFRQGDVQADEPSHPQDEATVEEVAAITSRTPVAAGALGRTEAEVPGVEPGVIVVRTSSHMLYYGLPDGGVRAYPVAVGKQGAQWQGEAVVGRKAVNPTWRPTANQRRQKRLPRVVRAGPRNPLGVRALYLYQDGRDTLYRIHGTNAPNSIGRSVSSGCIRMRNADVVDLFSRVPTGTHVIVE
jgi:lipoprotein-anchoring transpeptidase ErfK/SrfK